MLKSTPQNRGRQVTLNTNHLKNKKHLVLQMRERRKITIVKNKKQGNTYYSFQVGIPSDFLQMIQYGVDMGIYYVNRQHLKIKKDISKTNYLSSFPIQSCKRGQSYTFTFPKKKMSYLQACDEYLHFIAKLNSVDDSAMNIDEMLTCELVLSQYFDSMSVEYELELYIHCIIDKFIKYIQNNPELISLQQMEWIEVLDTDWNANYERIAKKLRIL